MIIIQARTQSTRYPYKILLPFYKNDSILDIVIQTCKNNAFGVEVVLATTENKEDEILYDYSVKHNIHFFRGSEQDVLKRFIDCSQKFAASQVLRVCSDNPFLAIDSIDNLLQKASEHKNDYLSYKNHKNLPAIKTHLGLFTEVVLLEALQKANSLTSENIYHEHVTNYIYTNPDTFSVCLLPMDDCVFFRDDIRLTCDTPWDFDVLKLLYELYIEKHRTRNICIKKLVDIIDSYPEIKQAMYIGIEMFKK